MKKETKRYLIIAAVIFVLFLAIHYWEKIQNLLGLAFSAALPLFVGCIIAFLINILMSFYERHYFPRSGKAFVRKSRRVVCMTAAILSLVIIVALIFILIVPEFINCIKLLISLLPGAMDSAVAYIEGLNILPEDIFAVLENIDWKSRIGEIANSVWTGVGNVMDMVVRTVSSVFSVVVTAFV
ncbi:MAG: AI-2E family transporter, partial [Eubacteriales bacterium]